MGKSLQNWLDNNGLGTIALGVFGAISLLAVILVVGGYFLVQP
jgi:hypothetical protein